MFADTFISGKWTSTRNQYRRTSATDCARREWNKGRSVATHSEAIQAPTYRSEFQRGVIQVAPVWIGVIPFGIMIGVSSVAAGFSSFEAIAMSAFVFAGAAQAVAISLLSGGAGIIAITITTFFLNLRHILYGMSIDRQLERNTRPGRPVLAFLLIDEAYGITTRDHLEGRGGHAFFFGVSLSFYIVYVLSTATGVLLGSILPDPESLGIDFLFPLIFVGLLVPMLKTRLQLIVVAVAVVTSLLAGMVVDSGNTIVIATVLAAGAGAMLERN